MTGWLVCWEWWRSTLMTPYKEPLVASFLRALSVCQNWPAGPLPDQSFGQWNRLFPKVFVKNHLFPALYLGFDWSGSIVLTNGEGFSRSVLTNGRRPQCAFVMRSISWCCVGFQPLSFLSMAFRMFYRATFTIGFTIICWFKPRFNHVTSVHVTQNNKRFHNHAKLCKSFTKIYETIVICEARTIGNFGIQFY